MGDKPVGIKEVQVPVLDTCLHKVITVTQSEDHMVDCTVYRAGQHHEQHAALCLPVLALARSSRCQETTGDRVVCT